MEFINFILDAGWWSAQNGALWSFVVLFIFLLLVSYIASSVATFSLVPSWRRVAIAANISASIAIVVVSWGYLDNYTFHLEAARNGCNVTGPYQLYCPPLPQLP